MRVASSYGCLSCVVGIVVLLANAVDAADGGLGVILSDPSLPHVVDPTQLSSLVPECETEADCLNGGACRPSQHLADDRSKICHCPDRFGGTQCEHDCPLPCHNHGACMPVETAFLSSDTGTEAAQQHRYYCRCIGHFTGPLCEIPFDICVNGQICLHQGQCVDDSFDCACPAGYTGQSCEFAVVNEPFIPASAALASLVMASVAGVLLVGWIARWWVRQRRAKSTTSLPEEEVNLQTLEEPPSGHAASGRKKWLNII